MRQNYDYGVNEWYLGIFVIAPCDNVMPLDIDAENARFVALMQSMTRRTGHCRNIFRNFLCLSFFLAIMSELFGSSSDAGAHSLPYVFALVERRIFTLLFQIFHFFVQARNHTTRSIVLI